MINSYESNSEDEDDSFDENQPIEISNKSKIALNISKVLSGFVLAESILLWL